MENYTFSIERISFAGINVLVKSASCFSHFSSPVTLASHFLDILLKSMLTAAVSE